LKQERFADALELLGRLPAASEQDPDVLLSRAALLTQSRHNVSTWGRRLHSRYSLFLKNSILVFLRIM
jgi:hypothetical protein